MRYKEVGPDGWSDDEVGADSRPLHGTMGPLSAQQRSTHPALGLFQGQDGSCARVVVSWTVAGGIAFGGVVVGILTVTGLVSPGLQLLAAPVLFLLGAFLGAFHGTLLAVVGRPPTLQRGGATRKALAAVLVAVVGLFPAWIVTAGISLSAALVKEWHFTWALLSLGGWLIGLSVCAWAAREGWCVLCRAYARWPESRAGSVLTGVILVGACVASLRLEPELWGTGLKLNGVGALILALALTLWVGFPLVWITLRLVHGHLMSPHPHPHVGGGEAGTS